MSTDGASNNELLLAACKQDQDELLLDVLDQPGTFTVNCTDGLGNTPLHYAAQCGAFDCVKLLLTHKNTVGLNINIKNRIENDTPLHKAVAYTDDPGVAFDIVKLLLDAGANPSCRNKLSQKPVQLVSPGNKELRDWLDKAELAANVDRSDIADDDSDSDGEASD
ncbi:hypothetical protein H4R34_000411 [Dimargaris verticillata]|uniref:Ankyrin repeat-containing domain protein n=1 Tax=Dimargaris verticillata TaxID=2761393 RepID=A0A9W8EFD8_9FUNG|nr:hypothetical protein H4R34_000411 [Dimargaris verticillata]